MRLRFRAFGLAPPLTVLLATMGACSSSSGNDIPPSRYAGGTGGTDTGAGGSDAGTGGAGATNDVGAGGDTALAGSGGQAPTTFSRSVVPSDTDAAIDRWNAPHTVVIREPERTCVAGTQAGKNCDAMGNFALLLVHFVKGGAKTDDSMDYLNEAALLGYHVLSLSYPNDIDIASLCGSGGDPSCWENVRLEMIDGIDRTPLVDVSPANSIQHRVEALLAYLAAKFEGEGWEDFLPNGTFVWGTSNPTTRTSSVVVSGHGLLGAGQAAILALHQPLKHVAIFSGPTDGTLKLAPWIRSGGATTPSSWSGFAHTKDPQFSAIRAAWTAFGMDPFTPNEDGMPVVVETVSMPTPDTAELETALDPSTGLASDAPDAVITDATTPLSQVDHKTPIYVGAWDAMLHP